MASLAISVVVVSRNRPEWLRRCLSALRQLDYERFETIVVACPSGAAIARESGVDHVCDFDEANISAARNIGVDVASGEVVAFIDDDAVAEPTWLSHLAPAFEDQNVAQAGGTTLGRNGISVQHGASRVDAWGRSYPVAQLGDAPFLVAVEADRHPRVHGTNMALRRSAVIRHGGFDERYSFFLDETDLSYRLSCAGALTKFVPKAVVHHATGPSRFRDHARTPRRVWDIAASTAVFHGAHCPREDRNAAQAAFLAERRNWILRHMQSGALAPDTAFALIKELATGYAQGMNCTERPEPTWRQEQDEIPSKSLSARDIYLVRTTNGQDDLSAKARALALDGHRVTVFDYRANARYHRVTYRDGYWLHSGGIFGRELRSEPLFRRSTRQERITKTLQRITGIRSKKQLILGN